MDELEKILKNAFIDEAKQHLDECEQIFLNLDHNKQNHKLIERILRLAHSLKGAAGAAGFNHINEFTHELESLLILIKSEKLEVTDSTVSLLLECNDYLRSSVAKLAKDFEAKIENRALIEKIKNHALNSPNASENTSPKYKANPLKPRLPNQPLSQQENEFETSHSDSLRVSSTRLEHLNNLAGELVILQSVLNQHATEISSVIVIKTIAQLNKITKEIQTTAMACRTVPVKNIFLRLHRIARDTSIQVNKKVEVRFEGEDLEVDKTVVEHLYDPLMHIIRNAVDHGIESAEQRLACSKPEIGTIHLRAYQKGDRLTVEIEDDGAGLNETEILKRAKDLGCVPIDTNPPVNEIYKLIFLPNFSTRLIASNISGRGVGLAVAKDKIERVSGAIKIESEIGKKTIFRIQFPLTLAIAEGMIIKSGRERFVVPLKQVHETIRYDKAICHSITELGEALNLRGEVIPIYHLHDILGSKKAQKPNHNSVALVVRHQDATFAVVVDDVIRQQQVVMKQIGAEIRDHKIFMGSAILGDGQPALILDLYELVQGTSRSGDSTRNNSLVERVV